MTTFYGTNGEEIKSKEDFIKKYNSRYFLDGEHGTGTLRSSRYVENVIEHILYNGIENKRDVLRILAWKMGKIRHNDTEKSFNKFKSEHHFEDPLEDDYDKVSNEVCFVYSEGWKDAEQVEKNPNLDISTLTLKRWGHVVEITELVDFIVDNKERVYTEAECDPETLIEDILGTKPKQIGPVYIITLLYFFSKGEYPIYDQFADQALEAIINNRTYNEPVRVKTKLPDKSNSKFSKKLMDPNGDYMGYKKRIECVFGNYESNYRYNRDIDRALWVYGHQF